MKAVFKEKEKTGNIRANRRENSFNQQYTLVVKNGIDLCEVAVIRLYHTSCRSYACLWINCHKNGIHVSGGGSAGGGGYHRGSAAVAFAIDDAGISLSENIDGRGEEKIKEALQAIGLALGYKKSLVVHAHS